MLISYDDFFSMRVDSKSQFIASSQLGQRSKFTQIRIWSVKNLQTLAMLKDKIFNPKITDFGFTSNVSFEKKSFFFFFFGFSFERNFEIHGAH